MWFSSCANVMQCKEIFKRIDSAITKNGKLSPLQKLY